MKMTTRRIAFLGLMLAIGILAGYVERLVPPPIPSLPGIKLGLANAVILVVMYTVDAKSALLLNVARAVLTGLLFSGIWGMLYALSGVALSFTGMALLKKSGAFGLVGISVAGGALHNTGQLCLAALVMKNAALFHYLPILVASGVVAGIAVGYVAGLCVNRLHKANVAL